MKSTTSQSLRRRSRRYRRPPRRAESRQRLHAEPLEQRILLAGDTAAWHNAQLPLDTNVDGRITALDALVAINDLNANGTRDVNASTTPRGMVDVDANGVVSPADPLRVINHLNLAAGESHFKVRFRLAVTGLDSEEPLDSLNPNEAFLLRTYVTDVTDAPGGVFAAYLDVNYTPELADTTDEIDFSDEFPNQRTGDLSTDGLIDEGGAFFGSFTGNGGEETLLYSVPMTTENAAGTLTFTGDAADVLPAHEVLLFSLNDPVLAEEIEFVGTSIQITAGEDVTAENDGYNSIEDELLVVESENGVLANDQNPAGVDLTAVLLTPPANGTLELAEDGSFTYQPNENFFGDDIFTYAANNGLVNSNAATVAISVAGVNDAPLAMGETYTIRGSSTGVIPVLRITDPAEGLLANDVDVEGSPLTVTITLTTQNGELNATPDGLFTYVPDSGFSGTDSFEYVVNDGELDSEPVIAIIEVAPADGPTANPDTYLAVQNDVLSVAAASGVLVNDTDPNGDVLTALLVDEPTSGTVTLNEDGSFVYTPNTDFLGEDFFTYVADDNTSLSASAKVTVVVQVTGGGDAPIAENDAYEIVEGTTLVVEAPGVLANDTDADGDPFIANLLVPPQNGTLTLNPDGSFVYTPSEGFVGDDVFGYTAADGLLRSNAAGVTITVLEKVDNPPEANDESYDVEFETALVVSAENGVLANDFDPDGDPISAALFVGPTELPANGSLVLEDDGSFIYTPDAGFQGVDSFTYVVQSGELTSPRVATTTLNVQPPSEETFVAFRLETTDEDGVVLSTVESGEEFQLRVYVQDISPLPREGVFAAYLDVAWEAALATVNGPIDFSSVYRNGRTGNTNTPGLIDEAGAFDGDVVLGPGEQLLLSVPMVATGGGEVTFAANPADQLPFGDVLLFDTLTNAVPQELINYGSTTLTVEGLSQPVAVNDRYDAPSGSLTVSAAEGVLANDLSVGGTLTAMLEEGPTRGTLELNADGSFAYTAEVGFIGTDSFTYRAADVGSVSEPATVTIRVGDLAPSDLSGSVYFDTNNNGTREPHEYAFGGVEVLLSGTNLAGEEVSLSTVTDRDGRYSFADVLTGSYVLSQVQPDIVIDGTDSHDGILATANDSFQVTLGPGSDGDGYDFAERGLHPAFFGNPFFFASRTHGGASFGLRADGSQSWYSLAEGWESFRSATATLSADGSFVTINAVDFNGNTSSATVRTILSSGVLLTGNDAAGHYVKFTGPSSQYGLQPSSSTAAVDAVFAESS